MAMQLPSKRPDAATMTPTELAWLIVETSADLREALKDLVEGGREYAAAEAEYRRQKAVAYVKQTEGTIPERTARVEVETSDAYLRSLTADAVRQAALEGVRSLRGILSALQTLSNATREELALARTTELYDQPDYSSTEPPPRASFK